MSSAARRVSSLGAPFRHLTLLSLAPRQYAHLSFSPLGRRALSTETPDADYYRILGVSRDADASAIKAGFHAAAKRYHPDVHGEGSAELFKRVNEAYTVLSEPGAWWGSGIRVRSRGHSVSDADLSLSTSYLSCLSLSLPLRRLEARVRRGAVRVAPVGRCSAAAVDDDAPRAQRGHLWWRGSRRPRVCRRFQGGHAPQRGARQGRCAHARVDLAPAARAGGRSTRGHRQRKIRAPFHRRGDLGRQLGVIHALTSTRAFVSWAEGDSVWLKWFKLGCCASRRAVLALLHDRRAALHGGRARVQLRARSRRVRRLRRRAVARDRRRNEVGHGGDGRGGRVLPEHAVNDALGG